MPAMVGHCLIDLTVVFVLLQNHLRNNIVFPFAYMEWDFRERLLLAIDQNMQNFLRLTVYHYRILKVYSVLYTFSVYAIYTIRLAL